MSPTRLKAVKTTGYGAVSAAIGTFAVGLFQEWGIIPKETGPFSIALYSWMAVVVLQTALSPDQWKSLLGMSKEK